MTDGRIKASTLELLAAAVRNPDDSKILALLPELNALGRQCTALFCGMRDIDAAGADSALSDNHRARTGQLLRNLRRLYWRAHARFLDAAMRTPRHPAAMPKGAP